PVRTPPSLPPPSPCCATSSVSSGSRLPQNHQQSLSRGQIGNGACWSSVRSEPSLTTAQPPTGDRDRPDPSPRNGGRRFASGGDGSRLPKPGVGRTPAVPDRTRMDDMGSQQERTERIEALRGLIERLSAPDLTLAEAKLLRGQISDLLEREDQA